MQTEKHRERLVELLNNEISHLVLTDIDFVWTCEKINYLADYLLANGVVMQKTSSWNVTTETDVDIYTAKKVARCRNCGSKVWYKGKVVLKEYCCDCGAKMLEDKAK